jgi:hypothetical protein
MICTWHRTPQQCYINTERENDCSILRFINEADISEEDKQRLKMKCPGLLISMWE